MKSYKLCDVYVCKNIIKKMITICIDKSGNKDIFFTQWFIDVYIVINHANLYKNKYRMEKICIT
jgi:hypothetical protein